MVFLVWEQTFGELGIRFSWGLVEMMPGSSTATDALSEQDTDDSDSGFVEVDPTGRYGRVSYCPFPSISFSAMNK